MKTKLQKIIEESGDPDHVEEFNGEDVFVSLYLDKFGDMELQISG